jgi:hypothetical protein
MKNIKYILKKLYLIKNFIKDIINNLIHKKNILIFVITLIYSKILLIYSKIILISNKLYNNTKFIRKFIINNSHIRKSKTKKIKLFRVNKKI